MSAAPFTEVVALAKHRLKVPVARVALFRDGNPPGEATAPFVRTSPLLVEGVPVGFFVIEDGRPRRFDDDEEAVLRDCAALAEREVAAGLAIARARATAQSMLSLLDAVPLAVVVLDLDANVRAANATAQRILDLGDASLRLTIARAARGDAAPGSPVEVATKSGDARARLYATTVFETEDRAGRYLGIVEPLESVARPRLSGEERFDLERAALLDLLATDASVEVVLERIVAALEASLAGARAGVELLDGRHAGISPLAANQAGEWSLAPVALGGETIGNVRLIGPNLSQALPHYVREAAQLIAVAVIRERERMVIARLRRTD